MIAFIITLLYVENHNVTCKFLETVALKNIILPITIIAFF